MSHFDNPDSVLIVVQSTNVFVANLPPHVTEQSLGTFFARCGPVGSVRYTPHAVEARLHSPRR